MRAVSLRGFSLLLCVLLIAGCRRGGPIEPSAPLSSSPELSTSSFTPPESPPEPTPLEPPEGDYLLLDGVLYWSEGAAPSEDFDSTDSEHRAPVGSILRVTDAPEADGDATFGQAGGILYNDIGPYSQGDFSLLYLEGAQLWRLYPTERPSTNGTPTEEPAYFEAVRELVRVLEAGDAQGLARLAQVDLQPALYSSLADNGIAVVQTVYRGQTHPTLGGMSADLVVDVAVNGLLPAGRHRLNAFYWQDPRLNSPRPEQLPLSYLSLEEAPRYPQTDPDNYGWIEVNDMVTYRVDMPFASPKELPPHLLLRLAVPYAHRRAVFSDRPFVTALSVNQVDEAAQLLFGTAGLIPQSPDPTYYDQTAGGYTMARHNAATAGMGHSMDYMDPGLNFTFELGDRDGVRIVTITHFAEPLRLIKSRVLEYTVEKVIDPITKETIGRVLSAVQIQ